MHRQTPLTSGFVGFTAGGCRSLVEAADDDKGMQEMKGSMMFGEQRERVESPQNYGFTSVVLPAKKGKDGKIEESAEAYISYMGGNRSFPVAGVMDDRRHRPYGLKPGENAQYDDAGQMTLMRRNGLYLLTLDDEEGSGNGGASARDADGNQQENKERMVSLRHVMKKKQERPKGDSGGDAAGGGGGGASAGTFADSGSSGGGDQSSGKDHKHEGEEVNTEVRATKQKVEFRTGDDVVGHYNKESKEWILNSGGDTNKSVKVDQSHAHIKIGENSIWVDSGGCWSSKPIELKPDPNSAPVKNPLLERIEQLEARVAQLETHLA
jgi:phage gp45-like